MRYSELKAIVWKEGKHYVSQCLNVDVASFGTTKRQAVSNLHEALELYFEDSGRVSFQKVGKPEIVQLAVHG